MKRKFQPYDKQKLLAQIDLISIELVQNQVITKWGSTVLSVTQVSNRYEVFDIKSYLKSKIDLIEKNFLKIYVGFNEILFMNLDFILFIYIFISIFLVNT